MKVATYCVVALIILLLCLVGNYQFEKFKIKVLSGEYEKIIEQKMEERGMCVCRREESK